MNETYVELYEKLARLQWLLHRQRMVEMMEQGPFADTSKGQGRVLALLKIQPEISTKDLTYLLGIRQQSLNELLNRLEKGGYVERRPSQTDKRVMMVYLTEKGKNVQQPEPEPQNIFTCLNESEQVAFGEYLERIIAVLEEKSGFTQADMEAWIERARASMGEDRLKLLMRMRGMHNVQVPGHFFEDFPPFEGNHRE